MVIGILLGIEVGRESLVLQPGDAMVVYTDGVTEAFDAAGNMFDGDLLQAYLARAPRGSAAGIAQGVLGAVRRHAGEHPQSDDITIVTLCRVK
jgi:sigma-B regulation protein RsbU (phosphoserine phosphatase)